MDTASEETPKKTIEQVRAERDELQKKIVKATHDIAILCLHEGDICHLVDTIESCQQALECYKEAQRLLTTEEKMSLLGLIVSSKIQRADNTLDELHRAYPKQDDDTDPFGERSYTTCQVADMYDEDAFGRRTQTVIAEDECTKNLIPAIVSEEKSCDLDDPDGCFRRSRRL